jgi:molybdate transport system permease protein
MRFVFVAAAVLLSALLLLPVLALLWRGAVALGAGGLASSEALAALAVSARLTTLALLLIVLLATPTAWLLARPKAALAPAWRLLEALLDLPVVLPPVVAGLGLLFAFGRNGLLGPGLSWLGLELAFSPAAVVLAQVFTSAPYYLRSARAGFASLDPELLAAAQVDGANGWQSFRHVTWPLAWPFLAEGLVLASARAIGEFGATVLFAGSLAGQTRTVSLAVYSALEGDLNSALALALLLTLVAFGLLAAFRLLALRRAG